MFSNDSLSVLTDVMLNDFQFYALRQITADDLSSTDDNLKHNKHIKFHPFGFPELVTCSLLLPVLVLKERT